jgi:hypothetical protein
VVVAVLESVEDAESREPQPKVPRLSAQRPTVIAILTDTA